MTWNDFSKLLDPLRSRLLNMVARAIVTGVDDSQKVQTLQLKVLGDDDTHDDIERFGPYGLSSNPPLKSEAVVVFPGGTRDTGYCVGVEDRRYRIVNLSEGEVALYSMHGQTITLKANGDIELTPKAGQKVKVSSDVEVTGTLTASVDVIGGGKHLSTHTHSAGTLIDSGVSGGTVTGATGGPT